MLAQYMLLLCVCHMLVLYWYS